MTSLPSQVLSLFRSMPRSNGPLAASNQRSNQRSLLLPLLFAVAVPLLALTGCADKHIGRPCSTGLPNDDRNTASVNAQALECPSRICLLPARTSPTATAGPMCTDYCGGDDDCSDGEKFHPQNNPNGCKTGFKCRTPIGRLENPIACKRVCVCNDFLMGEEGDVPPASCQ